LHELFTDRAKLEAEMTDLANGRLVAQGVIDDPPADAAAG
jgi:hypothetical protein